MSPVDTVVGSFPAKDLDTSQLYYTLTSESVRPRLYYSLA